jgi:sterol desaturase/sphingolipid hydroxylase (fatty acid hydroxylase superfamily)
MSEEKKWSVERNFRLLVIILSVAALVMGMIPAFLIGHWLFFLGCVGAFVIWLWVAYFMARRLEWIHKKWLWKP